MPEYQMQNLVYLVILLCVIGYWGLRGYGGRWQKAVRDGLIWIAIFAVIYLAATLAQRFM